MGAHPQHKQPSPLKTCSGYVSPCYWHGDGCKSTKTCLKITFRYVFEADQKNPALEAEIKQLKEEAAARSAPPVSHPSVAPLETRTKRMQEQAQEQPQHRNTIPSPNLGQVTMAITTRGVATAGSPGAILSYGRITVPGVRAPYEVMYDTAMGDYVLAPGIMQSQCIFNFESRDNITEDSIQNVLK